MRTERLGSGETAAFGFDWSDKLDQDTIAASEWTIDAGITGSDAEFDTTSTECSFATNDDTETGEQYLATNTITTNNGFVYQRSLYLMVVVR